MHTKALILIGLTFISGVLQFTLIDGIGQPLLFAMALGCVAWVLSLLLKDAGIVDSFWGLFFVVSGLVSACCVAQFASLSVLPNLVLLVMVSLWAVRLSAHIFIRGLGEPEDKRYAQWRVEGGKFFWIRSLVRIFLLQATMAWAVCAPINQQLINNQRGDFTILALIAIVLWLFGFIYQSVADYQLVRFKRDENNQGKLLNTGLWQYSRHPNYFAEIVMWLAIYVYTLSYGGAWFFIGTVIICYTLIKFSGAWMLDEMFKKSKKGFDEYQQKTPSLIPTWLIK